MENRIEHINQIVDNGFTIIDNVYSTEEIEKILTAIGQVDSSKETFRKTDDLFAIRQFLKEVPRTIELIFTDKLKSIVEQLFGEDYFVVKSIYFDKPEASNWFVSYHQDLTISVDKKLELKDFGPWTVKQNQFGVQPPIELLEKNFTIRIHLDDTDENNGALKIIPKSHLKKICRLVTLNISKDTEVICNVKKGGIMIMKPLLFHSSGKSTNNKRRRVIHIEFSNSSLPQGLQWSEKIDLYLANLIT